MDRQKITVWLAEGAEGKGRLLAMMEAGAKQQAVSCTFFLCDDGMYRRFEISQIMHLLRGGRVSVWAPLPSEVAENRKRAERLKAKALREQRKVWKREGCCPACGRKRD